MKRLHRFLSLSGLVGVLLVSTGCVPNAAIQHLTPAERTSFDAYSNVMTPKQVNTYLAKATPAERNAYLNEIGLTQRFQALDPQDRESVLIGSIRIGMRADALYFLWGKPYLREGPPGKYERWYYLGSSVNLHQYGNDYSDAGTLTLVQLVDDRVEWWLETVPTDIDAGDNEPVRR
jgi:hypothetical protein